MNHSFWIPQLGGKTDLIPNHPNSMWMDPKRAGVYLGQCAQFCGLQHAMVLLRVSVDTREDFAAWVLNQQQPGVQDAKVAAGRHVFETQACINCHSINGTSGTVAWLSMNLAYLGWHIPRAYEFALKSESCHNLEHLCFLATSIQFWWVVIASSPYRRSVISAWVVVPYLLVADIVNKSFCFAVLFRAAALSQLRTNCAHSDSMQ